MTRERDPTVSVVVPTYYIYNLKMSGNKVSHATMVAICIPTLKRLDGLRKLLDSIEKQIFPKLGSTPVIQICIVDNDPAASAKQVVDDWQEKLAFPIIYEVEKRPGIPFVRNKLVSIARNAEFIVFIDDDEIATPTWLDELLSVQARFDADVVMGSLAPIYEESPPAWILKGDFHASNRFQDGLTTSSLLTGNVLLRSRLFSKLAIAFEEEMALTGGTDVLLGRHLRKHGVEFYWADNALVNEIVPAQRCRVKWLLLRRFRGGSVRVLANRFAQDNNALADSLLFSFRIFIIGILKTATCAWKGKHAAVKGIGYMVQSVGVIAGLFGSAYQEYKGAHQSKLP